MMISVLFARGDSRYKSIDGFDVWDIERDARNYSGTNPVICHPPCRAWGILAHMAKPREGEKELALLSVDLVRANGGVLEHPKSSRLWKLKDLPTKPYEYDSFGGFYIDIDQYDFGHVAHKDTRLYIKGISIEQLPPLPPKNTAPTDRSIAGNVKGTKRCTQYQREYTPDNLIYWIKEICDKVGK